MLVSVHNQVHCFFAVQCNRTCVAELHHTAKRSITDLTNNASYFCQHLLHDFDHHYTNTKLQNERSGKRNVRRNQRRSVLPSESSTTNTCACLVGLGGELGSSCAPLSRDACSKAAGRERDVPAPTTGIRGGGIISAEAGGTGAGTETSAAAAPGPNGGGGDAARASGGGGASGDGFARSQAAATADAVGGAINGTRDGSTGSRAGGLPIEAEQTGVMHLSLGLAISCSSTRGTTIVKLDGAHTAATQQRVSAKRALLCVRFVLTRIRCPLRAPISVPFCSP